jgi:hypothetical protein
LESSTYLKRRQGKALGNISAPWMAGNGDVSNEQVNIIQAES